MELRSTHFQSSLMSGPGCWRRVHKLDRTQNRCEINREHAGRAGLNRNVAPQRRHETAQRYANRVNVREKRFKAELTGVARQHSFDRLIVTIKQLNNGAHLRDAGVIAN